MSAAAVQTPAQDPKKPTIGPVAVALSDYLSRVVRRKIPAAIVGKAKLHIVDTLASIVSDGRLRFDP
jgi:hypothetical protein